MRKAILGMLVILTLLTVSVFTAAEDFSPDILEEPIVIEETPGAASAETGEPVFAEPYMSEVDEEKVVEEIVVVYEPMSDSSTVSTAEPELEAAEAELAGEEPAQPDKTFDAHVTVEISPEGELTEEMAFQLKARVTQATGAYTLRWERHDPDTDKPDEEPIWKPLGVEPSLGLTASLDLNALDFRLVVTGGDGTELTVAVPRLNVQPKPEASADAEADPNTESVDTEIVDQTEEEAVEVVEAVEEEVDEYEPESADEAAETPDAESVGEDLTGADEAADTAASETADDEQTTPSETADAPGEATDNPAPAARKVTVRSTLGNCIASGAPVCLTVELEGFEHDTDVTVIWEVNAGDGWYEAGTGERFEYTASIESLSWDIRARVRYTP